MNQPQVILNIIDILKNYPEISSCTIKLSKINQRIIVTEFNLAPFVGLIVSIEKAAWFASNWIQQDQINSIYLEYNFKQSMIIDLGNKLRK